MVASVVLWGDLVTLLQVIGYMITSMGLLSNLIGYGTVREHLKARLCNLSIRLDASREECESVMPLAPKLAC